MKLYLSFQKPNINNSETLTFQIVLSNIETQPEQVLYTNNKQMQNKPRKDTKLC